MLNQLQRGDEPALLPCRRSGFLRRPYSDLIVLMAEVSIRHPTNKHHIIDAVPICLRGYYKSIATQSLKLTRLYNQKPDEVVQRYLSTATAIHQQAQCVKQEAMSELTMES